MPSPPGVGAYGLVSDYRYGRAFEQLVSLDTFAGNATRTYKIGGTYIERIVSVAFQVVAVGAATRLPQVALLDAEGVTFSGAVSAFNITAGLTSEFVFAADAFSAGANGSAFITTPLPMPFLQPGYSLVLSVGAGVVADTVSRIRLLTQKFSTAPEDFAPGQGESVTPESVERSFVHPLSVT